MPSRSLPPLRDAVHPRRQTHLLQTRVQRRRLPTSQAGRSTARRHSPGPAPQACHRLRVRRLRHQVGREQRCGLRAFMRRVGLGGPCPHCDEPVAITDLLSEEVSP